MGNHHGTGRHRGVNCIECGLAYIVADDLDDVNREWSSFTSSTETLQDYVVAAATIADRVVRGAKITMTTIVRILGPLGRVEGRLTYSTTEKFVREGRCFSCAFKTAVLVCDSSY